jgi:hypothetical protein
LRSNGGEYGAEKHGGFIMKKAAIFLCLFCFSALWCFAEESPETGEDNQTSLPYFDLSLPVIGFSNGFLDRTSLTGYSTVIPILPADSLGGREINFRPTKYASYGRGFTEYALIVGTSVGASIVLLLLLSLFFTL